MDRSPHPAQCICTDCNKSKLPSLFLDQQALLTNLPLDNDNSTRRLIFRRRPFGPEYLHWPRELSLQTIPNRLYQSIISHLAIQDLTTLRRVSQYTRTTIDATFEYQEVYKYASGALRACLATGTASTVTLASIHYALTHPECVFCSVNFGAHLSLFTGNRVCGFCLYNHPRLDVIPFNTLRGMVAFYDPISPTNPDTLTPSLPTLHTLPGTYGIGTHRMEVPRTHLVSLSALPKRWYDLICHDDSECYQRRGETSKNRMEVKHNPYVNNLVESDINIDNGLLGNSILSNIIHGPHVTPHIVRTRLYTTSILLPLLRRHTKEVEHGIQCRMCVMKLRFLEYHFHKICRETFRHLLPRRLQVSAAMVQRTRILINATRLKSAEIYTEEGAREHAMVCLAPEAKNDIILRWVDRLEGALEEERREGGEGDVCTFGRAPW